MKYFIGLILVGSLSLSVPAHAEGLTGSETDIVRVQYYVYGRDCDWDCRQDIRRQHRWAERQRREQEEEQFHQEREQRRYWRWHHFHGRDD